MPEPAAPPPLRNTLREGLAVPLVLLNPLRFARRGADVGHGRPALVIPGLLTGDISTSLLRRTLKAHGFEPEGWRMGIDTGLDSGKLGRLEARLAELHRQSGRKVLLIGWSLGGLYARALAHRVPEHVDLLVTVASPFSGDRRANRAWKLYEAINDHTVDNPPFAEQVNAKPPVPTLAVWSAVDGVIAPACTRGRDEESDCRLRIDAQHFALGTSRRAIEKIIAAIAGFKADAVA